MTSRNASSSRSDIEKVAIVLRGLGNSLAKPVLNYLSVDDVKLVLETIPLLENVNEEEVQQVICDFMYSTQNAPMFSNSDEMEQLVKQTLSEKEARAKLNIDDSNEHSRVIVTLNKMKPSSIHKLIHKEPISVQVVILSYLDSNQSAATLSLFDESDKPALISRMAKTNSVTAGMFNQLGDLLRTREVENNGGSYALDGTVRAAEILNSMSTASGKDIVAKIREKNEGQAEEIEVKRFTFEHLLALPSDALSSIAEKCDSDDLATALSQISEEKMKTLLDTLGIRGSKMLLEEIQAKKPRHARIIEARQKVIETAKRLDEEDVISLHSESDIVD